MKIASSPSRIFESTEENIIEWREHRSKIWCFLLFYIISNRRNVATVFTSILLLPRVEGGEGEKNHTADDRREWVERVTFHKRCEKTALSDHWGGERERKRAKRIARRIANMHMQHHARSLIVHRSFDALSFNRALFVPEKCCFTSGLYHTAQNFDTSKWYATCASTKPSRLSPVAVTHR